MTTYDLTIHQGKTFQRVVRWEAPPLIYRPISAITQSAPVEITAATHGVPNGWRVAVTAAGGMDEINASSIPPKASDFHKATVIDANTIQLNEVVSSEYDPYTSGGSLVYWTPVTLTGVTARMTIKNRPGGSVLHTMVSPTDIAIDNTNKTISLSISATNTATFAKGSYVYDLEAQESNGVVTLLLAGSITVVMEVTT